MISLFSSPAQKDNAIDSQEEAGRAGIQAAIDRALYIPAAEIAECSGEQELSGHVDVEQNLTGAQTSSPWADYVDPFAPRHAHRA